MLKRVFVAAVLSALLASCASSSADIKAAYMSPLAYQGYDCSQLAAEAQSVSARAAEAAGVQDSNRSSDAVMTTVGAVVFWPALFALKGDGNNAAELGRLKGMMQAIEDESIHKKCGITFERPKS
jgi:hypothetical protein